MSFLRVEGLWHYYGATPILEGIDLEIEAGSFCAIVGASGCGKSTFLRLLLGQERPSRGALALDGRPLAPEPGRDRGIVFQHYSVFPYLTVAENLILSAELAASRLCGRFFGARRKAALKEAEALLERIGLAHVRDHYPAALSGGMRQRLAIAQSLSNRPRLLLLDEPFGALDAATKTAMHDVLLDLWKSFGMTVLMVTHDLNEGFKLGTRVLVFAKSLAEPGAPQARGATIAEDLPAAAFKASLGIHPPSAQEETGHDHQT